MDEFSLIRHYFSGIGIDQPDVELAVGDDAALLRRGHGGFWAVAADMLVEGRHFPVDSPAGAIARRALRVNLSDMAAMAAKPRFYTLTISLPAADEAWLAEFSGALQEESRAAGVTLIGGDTTAGPLSLSLQLIGEVEGVPLLRSTAQAGDDIWVTGDLGSAAAYVQNGFDDLALDGYLSQRFWNPEPRTSFALAAAAYIHAAIDVSDGLWADLGHICERSQLGATIDWPLIPVNSLVESSVEEARMLALVGGDDYELCFTAAPESAAEISRVAVETGVKVSRIGQMTDSLDRLCLNQGEKVNLLRGGYRHF